MGVNPKIGVGPPKHPFVHRVWNHCKPSILEVFPLFLETPIPFRFFGFLISKYISNILDGLETNIFLIYDFFETSLRQPNSQYGLMSYYSIRVVDLALNQSQTLETNF